MGWEFITQPRGGRPLASLTDLDERKLNLYLNQPGDASGVMDLLSPQCRRDWLQPGVHEMLVAVDKQAIETVFQLATIEPDLDEQGGGSITFNWLGILSYLSNGFIGPNYVQPTVPQNEAAWNIVATLQAKPRAAWGITDGADTPGQPAKSLDQADEQDAKEALSQLAEREDGFDFWVDTRGALRTAYPFRGVNLTRQIIWEHGVNCHVSNLQEDASPGALINWVRVRGAAGASAVAEDTHSQLVYGRREAIVSYPDEADLGRLQQYANAIVTRRAYPSIVPVVKVDTRHPSFQHGATWLGDVNRLIAPIGNYWGIDADYRIVAMHFDIDAEDDEGLELEMNVA